MLGRDSFLIWKTFTGGGRLSKVIVGWNAVCYSDAVDSMPEISIGTTVVRESLKELAETGFSTIPGPLTGNRLAELVDAYDQVMSQASGPDFKAASTTNRMSDLLSFSRIFDEVFLHKPLLEVCSQVMSEPFKLSSFLGRTLRAGTRAQELHADLPRTSPDAPLLGFILMIDSFRETNGATRFVPGSHEWPNLPSDALLDARLQYPGEKLACGEAGSMLVFNAAIWHGHTANHTSHERRSIQGYFVRRNVAQGFDFRGRLSGEVKAGMTPLARYLLALDEQQ